MLQRVETPSIKTPRATFRTKIDRPEGGIELLHRRTRTGKSFALPNGKRRQIITIGHQHYWDGEAWQEVDNSVVESAGVFECCKTAYFWRAHQTGVGCHYKSRMGGWTRMRLLAVGTETPAHAEPWNSDNCLHYDDIAPETDFHWQLSPSFVCGWVTLWGPTAPRECTWEFIHNDPAVISRKPKGMDAEGRKLEIVCDWQTEELKPGLYRTKLVKRWTGRVGTRNPKTREMLWSDDAAYPVAIDPDISESIVANGDDGYDDNGGYWNTSPTKIATDAFAGWRWQTVAVPNSGDTIDLANFKIYIDSYSGSVNAFIYGYDADDAAAWGSGGSPRPSTAAKTTAKLSISTAESQSDRTYNVTSIIQEIVDRGGWATGNDMALFMLLDGTTSNNCYFHDYASNPNFGRLEIDYTAGSSPTNPWHPIGRGIRMGIGLGISN